MSIVVFDDAIITPSELRSKQKTWLNIAYDTPVTIKYRDCNLALLNRETARTVYKSLYYAEKVIRFINEMNNTKTNKSETFPWVKYLDTEEIDEFYNELLVNFTESSSNKNWLAFEEMIDAWIATSEAKTHPEIMELIKPNSRKRKYVKLR